MAERLTIYAGEPLASVLAGWEDNRSGRVNAIADAYREFVDHLVPVLDIKEWCALADVANGFATYEITQLRVFWASVADSGPDGLAEKWGVDLDALAAKVRALPMPQLLAMREVLDRFWNADPGSHTTESLLRACGAREPEVDGRPD